MDIFQLDNVGSEECDLPKMSNWERLGFAVSLFLAAGSAYLFAVLMLSLERV